MLYARVLLRAHWRRARIAALTKLVVCERMVADLLYVHRCMFVRWFMAALKLRDTRARHTPGETAGFAAFRRRRSRRAPSVRKICAVSASQLGIDFFFVPLALWLSCVRWLDNQWKSRLYICIMYDICICYVETSYTVGRVCDTFVFVWDEFGYFSSFFF